MTGRPPMRTSHFARFLSGLHNVLLVTLVLACIPVAILLVGMPFVLLAWLIAGVAARW